MSSPTHAGIFPLDGGDGLIDWVRARAREIGIDVVPSLRELAENGSIAMRSAALVALAEIDPHGSEAFIVERIDADRSHVVHESGTRALGMMDTATSLELLRTTPDARAARIALHKRLANASNELLFEWFAARDRGASVALEILAERGAANDLVLDLVRNETSFITPRVAFDVHPTCDSRTLLEAIRDTPFEEEEEELPRALAQIAIRMDPSVVFDVMAPVVRANGVLSRPMLLALCAQLDEAWTRPYDNAIGFEDGDGPLGPLPDPRWHEVVRTQATADDWYLQSFVPGFGPPEPPAALRKIHSGAEDGDVFVLAGFEVRELSVEALSEVAERLGPRIETNLHYVEHQYGGTSCRQTRLVGLPLSSPDLRKTFREDGEGELALFHASESHDFPALQQLLKPFVPGFPLPTESEEAFVATEPMLDSLCEALEGLPMVRMLPNAAPWRPISGFWDVPGDAMRPVGPFTKAEHHLLNALGCALDLGAPRLFVLWANSD